MRKETLFTFDTVMGAETLLQGRATYDKNIRVSNNQAAAMTLLRNIKGEKT
jgi:hypothetical protein